MRKINIKLLQFINLQAKIDGIPEKNESFELQLDDLRVGKDEGRSYSGADINNRKRKITIKILENDYPYGLLQFTIRKVLNASDILDVINEYQKVYP